MIANDADVAVVTPAAEAVSVYVPTFVTASALNTAWPWLVVCDIVLLSVEIFTLTLTPEMALP